MDNYTIVLFKNKIKKRIIKNFKTYKNAKRLYDKMIEENKDVIFERKNENGKPCNYELGLLEKSTGELTPYFVRDDMGRQIKIQLDDPDYNLVLITPYRKEEMIFDVKNSKRISVNKFIKSYLPKSGVKLISKINHKIVVQNEGDINLFSLKDQNDCDRFINSLSEYLMNKGRIDCILVKDSSQAQKKYLYDILESNGYPKSVLYRRFTTYKRT